MKLIPLTQGQFAQVDDEDFERVSKHKWYAAKAPYTYYAQRAVYVVENGIRKQHTVYLHNVIIIPSEGKIIDHKDRNGLNNKKSNLREGSRMQNGCNRPSHKGSSSKYLGVSLNQRKGKYKYWSANIKINKILVNLGSFPYTTDGEIKAAKAYDDAAIKHFGEFANPNFKNQ